MFNQSSLSESHRATRRNFLATTAGLAVASSLPAFAAQAPAKSGKPTMKLSLAAYSFNRYLSNRFRAPKADAKMTLLDFVDYCAELKLDGCELTGYYFPRKITPSIWQA